MIAVAYNLFPVSGCINLNMIKMLCSWYANKYIRYLRILKTKHLKTLECIIRFQISLRLLVATTNTSSPPIVDVFKLDLELVSIGHF